MKNKLLLIAFVILLAGCKANYPVAQQSGKEDIAYLLFVSGKEYKGKTVTVDIDQTTRFEAKVVKARKANRRGTQYGVSTGRKNITVQYEGRTIYNKQIFLSSQETKQILLP